MTAAKRSVVVGVFDDPARAEKAIRDLLDAEFKKEEVGFAMRQPSGEAHEAKAPEGVSGLGALVGGYTGVAAGGVLGGLLGLALTAAVPGFGPVFVAGMVGMALGGAYVGGIVGVLVGMGIPHHEAEHYHRHVQAGRALVTVKAEDRYSEAVAILSANGALDALRQPEQMVTAV
jgi:hypothetical protein